MKQPHAPAATKEHSAKKTPAKKTATKATAAKKPAAAKKTSAKATATKHHAHHAEPAAHTHTSHAHAPTHSGTKKTRATSRKKPSGVISKAKTVARKVGKGIHTVAKAGRKHLAHVINVKRRKTKHGYEKRICLVIPD